MKHYLVILLQSSIAFLLQSIARFRFQRDKYKPHKPEQVFPQNKESQINKAP